MDCQIVSTVNIDDLAGQLDYEEAKQLIIAADFAQQDWDFTLEMAKHFVGLLKDGVEDLLDEEYITWIKEV